MSNVCHPHCANAWSVDPVDKIIRDQNPKGLIGKCWCLVYLTDSNQIVCTTLHQQSVVVHGSWFVGGTGIAVFGDNSVGEIFSPVTSGPFVNVVGILFVFFLSSIVSVAFPVHAKRLCPESFAHFSEIRKISDTMLDNLRYAFCRNFGPQARRVCINKENG